MKISLGILTVVAIFGLVLTIQAPVQAGGCGHPTCDCGCAQGAECTCAKGVKADAAAKATKAFASAPAVGTKATCPVMNEEFTVKADSPRAEYKGKHYVFCCPGCKPKFDADPAKYADK